MEIVPAVDLTRIAPSSSAAVSGVKSVSAVPEKTDEIRENPGKYPVMDEYTPAGEYIPAGIYQIGTDADGNRIILFDAPDLANSPADSSGDPTVTDTDDVDREIENLKKKIEQVRQQISRETDPYQAETLRKELARLENELRVKDNDAYRRQNAVVTG